MLRATAIATAVILFLGVVAVAAHANVLAAPEPNGSLNDVIKRLRDWLVGFLVALATLMATVGGLRYLLAGGDPGEISKAKNTLKAAAMGYSIAALAPLLVKALTSIVGA